MGLDFNGALKEFEVFFSMLYGLLDKWAMAPRVKGGLEVNVGWGKNRKTKSEQSDTLLLWIYVEVLPFLYKIT